MIGELTEDQKKLILELRRFFYKTEDRELIIDAPGGTGKTTVIASFLKYMKNVREEVVAVVAPTHKAVEVISQRIGTEDPDIPCLTIHSFLGLTMEGEREDKLVRREDYRMNKSISILVVDEASMINRLVYWYLKKYIESTRVKVIYCGDRGQLPPVGEASSVIFDSVKIRHTLTENLRSNNGHIIKYRDFENFPEPVSTPVTMEELKEKYENSPAGSVILCWTNEACKDINSAINGNRPMKPGDIVVCTKTHTDLNGEIIFTGKLIKILVRKDNIINGKYLAKHFDFSSAMTVHKAQGSGFPYVFIYEDDIRKNKNIEDMKKALYTAVSRTKTSYEMFKIA